MAIGSDGAELSQALPPCFHKEAVFGLERLLGYPSRFAARDFPHPKAEMGNFKKSAKILSAMKRHIPSG